MTRQAFPLIIDDVSLFARSLKSGLELDVPHQSLLNAVSRAAGYRNFQHLSARRSAPDAQPVDRKAVARAAARFDAEGRFTGWPARHGLKMLCLWPIWARLPARRVMTEPEISELIHAECTFRDAASIRRFMVGEGMLTRTADGSEYRRVEQAPSATQRALIAEVGR